MQRIEDEVKKLTSKQADRGRMKNILKDSWLVSSKFNARRKIK